MDDLINLSSEKAGYLILENCSASWPQALVPPSSSFSSYKLHLLLFPLQVNFFDRLGSNYYCGFTFTKHFSMY